jgi:hypothetical protein
LPRPTTVQLDPPCDAPPHTPSPPTEQPNPPHPVAPPPPPIDPLSVSTRHLSYQVPPRTTTSSGRVSKPPTRYDPDL